LSLAAFVKYKVKPGIQGQGQGQGLELQVQAKDFGLKDQA